MNLGIIEASFAIKTGTRSATTVKKYLQNGFSASVFLSGASALTSGSACIFLSSAKILSLGKFDHLVDPLAALGVGLGVCSDYLDNSLKWSSFFE